jgi:hypothetical protein
MKFWTQGKELEAFKSKPQRMGRNTSTWEGRWLQKDGGENPNWRLIGKMVERRKSFSH